MAETLRVACLQTRPRGDMADALTEATALGEAAVAEGAELLALPEYCGGLRAEAGLFAPPALPEGEHPVLAGLRDFAALNGVWLLIGSVAVAAPDGQTLNRGYVVDASGAVRSRYDKIHLFDVALSAEEVYRESAVIAGGAEAVSVETPWGRLGHTICYDLRFPGLYRDLAQAGATILAVPAAFTRTTGEAHWHVLNRARAIENGAFVLAPCATGRVEGGGEVYGHSLIIGPWGEVLADAGTGPGIALATLELGAAEAARRRIPSLGHDRPYRAASAPARRDVA